MRQPEAVHDHGLDHRTDARHAACRCATARSAVGDAATWFAATIGPPISAPKFAAAYMN
jgi:hypothetical protein